MAASTTLAALLALAAAASSAAAQIAVLTEACSSGPVIANQSFVARSCSGSPQACIYESSAFPGQCITAQPSATAPVLLATCNDGDSLQQWAARDDGTVQQMPLSAGWCWNVDGGVGEPEGTAIINYNCGALRKNIRGSKVGVNGNDVFAFLPQNQIFANGSNMCLDLSLPPPPPPPPKEWTYIANSVLGGHDAAPAQSMLLDDAKALCLTLPECWGLSYSGPLNPSSPQLISFKQSTVPVTMKASVTLLNCGVYAPCPPPAPLALA